MAGKRSIVGEVAREYCTKYPGTSTAALARLLLKEQSRLFTNYSQARASVQYQRGERKNGDGNFIKSPILKEIQELPDSDAVDIAPVPFPATGRGIIISDLHIPYHDQAALQAAIDHAVAHGLTDHLTINGDFMDCYQLSKFTKDPRMRDFKVEVAAARQALDYMVDIFGTVILKLGNHDDRYEKYLYRKAPELVGVDEFELSKLLHLEELGVHYVPATHILRAGKLSILHGHEYGRGLTNPVNPARGAFLKAQACTVSGHLHRTSQHNERDILTRVVACWSTGCLCCLTPEYAPLNKWDHGFAEFEFDGHDFAVNTRRIINGKAT